MKWGFPTGLKSSLDFNTFLSYRLIRYMTREQAIIKLVASLNTPHCSQGTAEQVVELAIGQLNQLEGDGFFFEPCPGSSFKRSKTDPNYKLCK